VVEKNTSSLAFDLNLDRGRFTLRAKAELPASGITVVLGKSGSGKTTLLRCLAGLERRTTGTIQFQETQWLSANTQVPTHLRRCGYVFQHAALFPHLDVQENLEYARKRSRTSDFETDAIIELAGLRNLLEQDVDSLSGGERQRVALARTLLSGAKILLLDEPLASLDHSARNELLSLIEHVAQQFNIPILYVTHSLAEAARLASHALILEKGRVVTSADANEVFASSEVIAGFSKEPQSIIECRCQSIDKNDYIGLLSFEGGVLHIPNCALAPGATTRALIKARDISLSLDKPTSTSILNAIECRVSSVAPQDQATMLINLQLQTTQLKALITKRSAQDLKIAPDQRIFALIKAVSLVS